MLFLNETLLIFDQVKLVEAEEKISTLTRELDSVKSDLKSNSEKMNLEQKRFGTVSGSLKEELDEALEKIEKVICLKGHHFSFLFVCFIQHKDRKILSYVDVNKKKY